MNFSTPDVSEAAAFHQKAARLYLDTVIDNQFNEFVLTGAPRRYLQNETNEFASTTGLQLLEDFSDVAGVDQARELMGPVYGVYLRDAILEATGSSITDILNQGPIGSTDFLVSNRAAIQAALDEQILEADHAELLEKYAQAISSDITISETTLDRYLGADGELSEDELLELRDTAARVGERGAIDVDDDVLDTIDTIADLL